MDQNPADLDLSDVVLDGVQLVSDDPNDWVICRSLVNTTDLFGWWESFAEQDDLAWQAFKEQMAELRSLRDQYDELVSVYDGSFKSRRAQREIFVGMLHCGFSIGQVAALCNSTSTEVARSLIVSRSMAHQEAQARLDAERLLRLGKGHAEVARIVGLSKAQVFQWAQTLGVEGKPRNRFGSTYGPEIKARAMTLYDMGYKNREIIEVLKVEFPEETDRLKTDAISQWAHRSGRTLKRKSA